MSPVYFVPNFILKILLVVGVVYVSEGLTLSSSMLALGRQDAGVGKSAADQYFIKRKRHGDRSSGNTMRTPAAVGDPRYLQLHVGTYVDDDAYSWGDKSNREELGELSIGVTYRVGEWVNSMDLLFRADINTYKLKEDTTSKISLMPIFAFPDANSGFPLYFGAGAGLGVYFKQIDDESSLSFDYTLLAGVRLFELIEGMGFSFETGLKNHVHLLSDGQYNGVFVSLGSIFTF